MLPTKPLREAPPSTRSFLVAHDVLDVADRARAAALAFLRGSNGVWGKRGLAEWLVGPYRAAVETIPSGILQRSDRGTGKTIVDGSIEALLVRTRGRILEMLDDRASWELSGFARYAVDSSLVVAIHDAGGGMGYAPAVFESMRLVDRVLSLVLADYLTRRDDYGSLVVCDDCGQVSFEWAEEHLTDCWPAEPMSGIIKRRGTMAGIGTTGT